MTAATHSENPIPPKALAAIGLSLLVILVLVASVRLSGADIRSPDAAPVSTLALRFEDRPDGSVAVIDAERGQLLDTVVGEAGFLRGALRGLARERRRLGLGSEQAFQLVGRADGRLTLVDPATSQRIDLESFGPTNAAVFMRFMVLGRGPAAHSVASVGSAPATPR